MSSNKSKSDDHDVAVAGLHQGEEWKYRAETFNSESVTDTAPRRHSLTSSAMTLGLLTAGHPDITRVSSHSSILVPALSMASRSPYFSPPLPSPYAISLAASFSTCLPNMTTRENNGSFIRCDDALGSGATSMKTLFGQQTSFCR